jgi:hypothetical protein
MWWLLSCATEGNTYACFRFAQKSGYLYKRAPQSNSWQQRYVTLNVESGLMKFFAEKGG